MKYGYDGRHLFSYDGEFQYLGRVTPPEGISAVEDEMVARMTGNYFLSGRREPSMNIWSDGENVVAVMTYLKDKKVVHANVDTVAVGHHVPVCLSGPIVYDGRKIAQFCNAYPSSSVFVCPVVEELAAFGMACEGVLPRRAFLDGKVEDGYGDLAFQEYDKKLDGDGLGRMASVVAKVGFAVNQMMKPVGISGFYGRSLFRDAHPDGMYIVQSDSMVKYFPSEPISLKCYAATSVPVVMKVTDEFRNATKCDGDEVAVLSSTDYIRGLPAFMRFYQLMTGRDWLCFSGKYALNSCKRIPVFRYNRAYMVPIEDYLKDCK